MAKAKKQEEPTSYPKPRKRALKPEAKPTTAIRKVPSGANVGKVSPTTGTTPAKASKKTVKAEPAKTKRKSHAVVSDEAVLSALSEGKPLGKKELVEACGGDPVAVTKTVLKLRGEGKVVATGRTRSTLYRAV